MCVCVYVYVCVCHSIVTASTQRHMLTFQQQDGEMKGTWETGGFTSTWYNDYDNEYMVAYGGLGTATLTEIFDDEDYKWVCCCCCCCCSGFHMIMNIIIIIVIRNAVIFKT